MKEGHFCFEPRLSVREAVALRNDIQPAVAHRAVHQAGKEDIRRSVGTGCSDLPLRLRPISSLRLDQMEIVLCEAGIHIRVTHVFLFGSFVKDLDPADLRSFIFRESHDRILCCHSHPP